MNLLSWNCRGVGSPGRVRDLYQLVKENHPNILFLLETKCQKNKLVLLRVKMGYGGFFVVDLVGRNGGLVLFWRDDVNLEIQNFSRRHINSIIKGEGGGVKAIGSLQASMGILIGRKGMNHGHYCTICKATSQTPGWL
jgi:exonuclease III